MNEESEPDEFENDYEDEGEYEDEGDYMPYAKFKVTGAPQEWIAEYNWDEDGFIDDTACFSPLNHSGPVDVEYHVDIDETLILEEVQFYIELMCGALDEALFTWELIFDKKKFVFYLDRAAFNGTRQWLTYLTFPRYLQEFPEIVKAFYAKRGANFEDNFRIFQEVHDGIKLKKYDNLCGHGCLYRNVYGGASEPVSVDFFKSKLPMGKVQECFGITAMY